MCTKAILFTVLLMCWLSCHAQWTRKASISETIYLQEKDAMHISNEPNFSTEYQSIQYTIKANKDIHIVCILFLSCKELGEAIFYNNKLKEIGYYCTNGSEVVTNSIHGEYELHAVFFAGKEKSSSFYCVISPTGITLPPVTSALVSPVPTTMYPLIDCQCGEALDQKIINGVTVSEGVIPWQVTVQKCSRGKLLSFGGGSLVSSKFVISAAHCFYEEDYKTLGLFMGSIDLSRGGIERTINRLIVHPSYDDETKNNDIVIIEVDAVSFSVNLRPVCLPTRELPINLDGMEGTTSGFGYTEGYGVLSKLLKATRVKVVPINRCKAAHSRDVTNNMLCASGDNTDSCKGDSGGPFTMVFSERYYLMGIVSWGEGCNLPQYPGVYTKVTNYVAWIHQVTGHSICNKNIKF